MDKPDGTFPSSERVASKADVAAAYAKIAAGLQPYVDDEDCVLLGVLLGGMIPVTRLAAQLHGDFALDTCQVSRYRGREQGGELQWLQPPRESLKDRTVLIVDDIFDEGLTLDFVVRACKALGCKQVITAVLVEKRHDRVAVDLRPDFVGLAVEDRYVFGCGMDYRHRWRHLSEIFALKEDS